MYPLANGMQRILWGRSIMKISNKREDAIYESLVRGFELEKISDWDGAVAAFTIAAKLGSTDAKSMLGTIFDDRIVPARPREAVYWYKKGVEAGDENCAWNLAMHYKGLKQKRWYAYWLNVAKTMGYPEATHEIVTNNWWVKLHGERP